MSIETNLLSSGEEFQLQSETQAIIQPKYGPHTKGGQ